MKSPYLFLAFLIALPTISSAEPRTLTDKTGKQINAEIMAVRGDDVTIEMNGKEYTLPMNKFSDEDITYMKEWAEENPAPAVTFKSSELSISFKKNVERIKEEKEKKATNAKDKGSSKQSKNSESYAIEVSNRVSKEIPDMQVKYTIYKFVREKVTGENKSSSESLEKIEGTSEKTTVEKLGTFEFTTEAVIAVNSEKTEKKSGGKTTVSQDVWGVVTTIFSGDEEIRVDSFPDDVARKVQAFEEKQNEDN